MSIVNCINSIVAWTKSEVCSQIKFKLPDDDKNDLDYDEQYINPEVFPLYLPTKDRLPPDILAVHPSICIQIVEGKEMPVSNSGTIRLRFCMSTWNPGEHGADLFKYKEANQALPSYSNEASNEHYARNNNGWIDIGNFTDLFIQKVISSEFINGLRFIKEDGLEYGTFKEDNNIVDFYPYWFMWVECTFEYGAERKTPNSYSHLL